MDPKLWELIKREDENEEEKVEAIIRLDHPEAHVEDVQIISRFGPIATCRLRKEAIIGVRKRENVISLKAPHRIAPEMEPHNAFSTLQLPNSMLKSDIRRPPGIALTGKGVVVGIVDWGCDFVHPDFRYKDGSTRLLALWDQREPKTSNNYYGYGTILKKSQIDRALQAVDPYQALGYFPGYASHGTHVMGIAAGNGLGGGPLGVAPDAELAFVHLGSKRNCGLSNLGEDVGILNAIHFIKEVAGDKPWVVNLSMGMQGRTS